MKKAIVYVVFIVFFIYVLLACSGLLPESINFINLDPSLY